MRSDASEENEEDCGYTMNQKDHVQFEGWLGKDMQKWMVGNEHQ